MIPPHPFGIELEGKLVMIELLFVKKSAAELYRAYQLDQYGYNGTYLLWTVFNLIRLFELALFV